MCRHPLALLPLTAFAAFAADPFPEPIDTETIDAAPMPPETAAASLMAPDGFQVHVFAAEPEIRNPIAVSWDTRGRLWVGENFTFERHKTTFDARHRDRVLIFKDTNNDHQADERIVFHDQLQNLTSIEWAPGGLYVMCPPTLLFIPDADRDDTPDGAARVVLDGFTVPKANHHNFANGLRGGPDGWLYGRCGASAPGEIGAPGTPNEERIPLRGGIWRYHPTHQIYETLNCGLTNPWGHDWDQHGELFFVNTVNGHLWHSITGAHFKRGTSIDPNPHIYELIGTHADHFHFDTKGSWTKSRDGAANDFGGGHCHIGAMIYQADNWPKEYRNRLFTLNQHGRRANQETLERRGSGYVARHNPDILISGDQFFRAIDLTTGPDGGVYIIDWSDIGECHEASGVHRTSGRIFKVTHRDATEEKMRLPAAANGFELAGAQLSANAWDARMARLEIAARLGPKERAIHLERIQTDFLMSRTYTTPHRLRALWTLNRCDAIDSESLRQLLKDPDEHLRVWAIRLLTDRFPLDTVLSERPARPEATEKAIDLMPLLTDHAANDPSPMVRLYLASTLQRLPVKLRTHLALPLVQHAEDADDHNIPLMIWSGLIPLGKEDPSALAHVAAQSRIPKVREFSARFLASENATAALDSLLANTATSDVSTKAEVLRGLTVGFTARQKAPEPPAWKSFAASLADTDDPTVRDQLRNLRVLFGDGRALADIQRLVLDPKTPINTRKSALRTLISQKPDDLLQTCLKVLNVRFLNTVALDGIARFNDPKAAKLVILKYNSFHPTERARVLEVMVSRPVFAHALLDRIAEGKFARSNLTPYQARQILNLGDPGLTEKLTTHWGKLTEVAAEQEALIGKYRKEFTPGALSQANLSNGRVLFAATCATCHKLYGQGSDLGPDLTGGGRADLGYLLENIVTPSAVVTKDHQVSVVTLKDGRVLSGIIQGEGKDAFDIQTLTARETILEADVTSRVQLPVSFMPPGLLTALTPDQRRDLIAYLMHPNQVPLPE